MSDGLAVNRGIGGHTRPNNGRTNDWITPKHIIEALGPFDLDPCACNPQPWPTASLMLTTAENGLAWPWKGRVWLNPPYGSQIGRWMETMATHNYGTALVFARTETSWFGEWIWGKASSLLFLHGRLVFHHPDGRKAAANAGGPSVLIAYGERDAEILATSGLRGSICRESSVSSVPSVAKKQ